MLKWPKTLPVISVFCEFCAISNFAYIVLTGFHETLSVGFLEMTEDLTSRIPVMV